MLIRYVFMLLAILVFIPTLATAFELQPLTTRNLAPSVIGFGLPALEPARVLPAEAWRLQANFDLISNFTENSDSDEQLTFDGETYRLGLSVTYGISDTLEIGGAATDQPSGWISRRLH